MPLFHSSPESHHLSQSGESLSEAFMASSSRARHSLPEQYRTHFDELREGILTFCTEFQIPPTALSNREIFGNYLSSHTPCIPFSKMQEAFLLFQRLEYLLTHKEPLKEESKALKEVEPLYHLSEQYTAQVNLLERAGILVDGAIMGIDGNRYPIPTLEQIAECLCSPERRELFEIKRGQGFTKLLLVPFGMSLDELIEIFKQFLLDYKKTHPTFAREHASSYDDSDNSNWDPLNVWRDYEKADTGIFPLLSSNSPKVFYHPQCFHPIDHKGKTKVDILEDAIQDPLKGWRVLFLQPSDVFDLDAKGIARIPGVDPERKQEEHPLRPDVGANKTPEKYLNILMVSQYNPTSPYYGESGMTPEDWILAFMTHLEETQQPMDDCQSSEECGSFLMGSFFPSHFGVPNAGWSWASQQVKLDRWDPSQRSNQYGIRSAVVI